MKTRTYIIAGVIAFLIGLLITYAGFVFILLEANPLKWDIEIRAKFLLMIGLFSTMTIIVSGSILKIIEEEKSKP